MRNVFLGVAMAAMFLRGSKATLADTITLGASKDATIHAGFVNNSNGAGPGMFTGTDGNSAISRAVGIRRFRQSSGRRDNHCAQLTLVLAQVPGQTPANATIELHKMLADWGEGITGKQSPPTDNVGGTGQGVAANAGDATWNARFFSATTPTLWTTTGGDFSATASVSTTVGTTLSIGYNWTSTAALVADVQNWLDNPAANFGWELVNTNESSAHTNRTFFTRDTATATFRPQLQITYAVPEPSGIFLGSMIGLVLLIFGQRQCLVAKCPTF